MADSNPDPDTAPTRLRIGDLPSRKATRFTLEPDSETRAELAKTLNLLALRKLKLTGEIVPKGRGDWFLTAKLGATVVQPCSITLEPVTTRIDTGLTRQYLADWVEPEGDEVEAPEDDSQEAVPEVLDLMALLTEELGLALPLYPRAPGAELGQAVFAGPGTAPMTDEAARPFAALEGLRNRLTGDTDSEDDPD
ncbi:YceD family protein [Frigidibacter sp. ROC022]|uniref:YceD family protein n=1 Tax=Frigidibacter sp. ROC022 TaxID=2971796 RepID=UPI00215B08F5|nr:DUF177 domain-containing protein [Frigidibacter sp. ROC022]MCR8723246.1 YceD family protein [Frigidibacter sp. ROC022]